MRRDNPSRVGGFTLVEAIVALVVLSMSLMATYGWIQLSAEMLIKTDEVSSQEVGLNLLVEDLQGTDFSEQTAGEYEYGQLSFKWVAEPYEETRPGLSGTGLEAAWDHTLYVISIVIFRDSTLVANYRLRMVNSALVRPPVFRFGAI
jgi:prepilin-type N-terminal cleavage/methylation domain-containing protein